MKSFPFPFICKKCYRKILHSYQGWSAKARITVGKVHGHDKLLWPYMKPEKTVKLLSQLHSKAPMNQLQLQKGNTRD